jgi:type III secretion protein L
VSKQLFTLIYGDKVTVAPKTKVIKAPALSKMIQAQELLQKIDEDAEKKRQETVKECEQLKEESKKEGYDAGFKEWATQLAKLEEEITKVRGDLERVILPIALKAAKKIVAREIELDPTTIADIIGNNLKAVAQHKKIIIYVNKADLAILEANKPKLKEAFEHLDSFSIQERDNVQQGGCIIETEAGIINAQIDKQWETLEKLFEQLTKQKKPV